MTWLSILRLIAPTRSVSPISFGMAWKVQGLRVTAAEQDLISTNSRRFRRRSRPSRTPKSEETANEYAKHLAQLENDHDTYRRCVAAGKCGAPVIRLPMPNGADGSIAPAELMQTAPDAVPVAGEVAEGAEV